MLNLYIPLPLKQIGFSFLINSQAKKPSFCVLRIPVQTESWAAPPFGPEAARQSADKKRGRYV